MPAPRFNGSGPGDAGEAHLLAAAVPAPARTADPPANSPPLLIEPAGPADISAIPAVAILVDPLEPEDRSLLDRLFFDAGLSDTLDPVASGAEDDEPDEPDEPGLDADPDREIDGESAWGASDVCTLPPSFHDRLALARAVAVSDRGFEVLEDNRSGTWGSIAEFVAAEHAYAVEPQPSLLVIDHDLSGCTAEEAARRAQTYQALSEALVVAAVPLVEVRSGRTGHRHLFARIGRADPAARAAIEDYCRRGGLDVRSRGVRPPLTPHRSGAKPSLLRPPQHGDAINVLRQKPATAEQLRTICVELGLGRLSTRMRRLLRDGHAACGYSSASHGRMALAVAVLAAGYPSEYLAALLHDPANALGETFRNRPSSWQSAEIARLETKAKVKLEEQDRPAAFIDRSDALLALERWRTLLPHARWSGMGGATDLAVAEGLARIAKDAGGATFSASLPAIALAGGVSHDTARRSMRRLGSAGWVRMLEEATPTTARRWRLLVPEDMRARARQLAAERNEQADRAEQGKPRRGRRAAAPVAGPDVIAVDFRTGQPRGLNEKPPDAADRTVADAELVLDLGSDLARWGGLGKSAVRVLRELRKYGRSVPAIAGALSCSSNAVRIQLRKLERHGLASRGARGWRRGSASPTEVAQALGVLGRRATQAAQDAEHREQRRSVRERWRTAYLDAVEAVRNGDEERLAEVADIFGAKIYPEVLSRIRSRVAAAAAA